MGRIVGVGGRGENRDAQAPADYRHSDGLLRQILDHATSPWIVVNASEGFANPTVKIINQIDVGQAANSSAPNPVDRKLPCDRTRGERILAGQESAESGELVYAGGVDEVDPVAEAYLESETMACAAGGCGG
ncbi:hypothetical protein [Micromonospora sp. CPCC 205561]|uniref:hypothetical protein n=1 Tax=Micromonospora sp. CPCC 205561 TaxID=3122407 RepID=UPI002FF2BA22